MKKTLIISGIALAAVASILLLALFVIHYVVPIFDMVLSQQNESETLLIESESPDGSYRISAYRTEPGATVDFSVKVYLFSEDGKKLIYNAYHESKAEIGWTDDSTVMINGKTLDLSRGETYDWRK